MKIVSFFAAGICCFLLACSPTKNPGNTNNGVKSYNHLFIIGNTADISARVQLEKALAAAAAAKGYTVVKSIDIFLPSLSDPKPPTIEQVTDSLKATGCDALFVVNLKRKEEIKYNPGVKVNKTSTLLSDILSSSLGYHTTTNDIESVNKPGSYAYENDFYIAGDLVDAKTQVIVYSATSEIMEYSKLSTAGKDYMISLVEQLETKKMLRK
jgi:hypothetical protein